MSDIDALVADETIASLKQNFCQREGIHLVRNHSLSVDNYRPHYCADLLLHSTGHSKAILVSYDCILSDC